MCMFCYIEKLDVGLPDVQFLPGRPVFWPVCPAFRWHLFREYQDAIYPVFSMTGYGLHEINQLGQLKSHKCHCYVVLNVLTKVYIQ